MILKEIKNFITTALCVLIIIALASSFGGSINFSLIGAAHGKKVLKSNALTEASNIAHAASLYLNGRPDNGTRGTVREITSWDKFLYVSFFSLNGDFYLDAWDINDPYNPGLIETHNFGNIFDDNNRLIPVASLQGPRDLATRDGKLLVWTAQQLKVYKITADGRLEALISHDLSDALNPTLSRLSYGGNFAAVDRVLLSNQQFNQLIGTISQKELEGLLHAQTLISIQDPLNPFIIKAKRAHGSSYQTTIGALSGSYNDLPVSLVLADDKRTLKLAMSSLERVAHYNDFWLEKTKSIFNNDNRGALLSEIVDSVISDRFIKNNLRPLLIKLIRRAGLKPNIKLSKLISIKYSADLSLEQLLSQLKIDRKSSLEFALQRIIEEHIPLEIERALSAELSAILSKNLAKALIVSPDKALLDLKSSLTNAFNAELSAQGLVGYLINTVLAPLLDNPSYLNLTLAELLELITNNPLANVIDLGLGAFHQFFPASDILTALDFDTPGCFQIPNSAKSLLNLMLIQNGPKLKSDGFAFIEMLKLTQYYFGNTNFEQFESSLNDLISKLHIDLSAEVVNKLSVLRDLPDLNSISLEAQWSRFLGSFSLRSTIARIFAEGVLRRFAGLGIDRKTDLVQALAELDLYIDRTNLPADQDLSDVSDLQSALNNKLKLSKIALSSLMYRSGKLGADTLKNTLKSSSRNLLKEIFGALSDHAVFEEAISQFALARVPSNLMADLTKAVLDRVLDSVNSSQRFPGIIGKFQLAAQGECLAQWQISLEFASDAAAVSGILSGFAAPLRSAKVGLSSAADAAINYIVKSLVNEFVTKIFTERTQDYRSFQLGLKNVEQVIDLFNLAQREARQVDTAVFKDRVGVILRDMGASFPSATGNNLLTLLSFNPLQHHQGEILELGDWDTINSVKNSEQYLLITGNAYESQRIKPRLLIANYVDPSKGPYLLNTNKASDFSASVQLRAINGGEQFAVVTQLGVELLVP